MNVIWKYVLRPTGEQPIEMPAPATIISTAVVADEIVVYAIVDPNQTMKLHRYVHIAPTGTQAPDFARFVGTVVLNAFVFHIWTDHSLT